MRVSGPRRLPPARSATIVPDFFIFGAERSGTTLLAFLLSGQPDTFVVNDSFVFDRFAEWSLLGRARSGAARAARLGLALAPDLARSLVADGGDLRSRYYAARGRHLERYRPDRPVSAEQAAAYRAMLRARYLQSLAAGREKFLNDYAAALAPDPEASTLAGLFDRTLLSLAELHGGADRRLIGEKTPLHTFYAGWLLRFYPRARAILLVRDPAANVGSMRRRSTDLGRVLRGYEAYASRFLALAQHERVLVVRYEDVTADAPAQVSRILDFLGPDLRLDPDCPVNAYTKRRSTGTAVDAERSRVGEAALSPEDRGRIRRRFRAVYEAFYD